MDEYAKKNAVVIGVSFDSREENERFALKNDFPFALLSDTGKTIGMAYGASESQADEYARRIAYLIGEDGRIVEAHEKVNASSYPREQLQTL